MPRIFTFEILAYLSLAFVSLVLRIWASSRHLLNQEEALRALAAWEFLQGQPPEPAWPLSPALMGLQTLVFFLFGPGDVAARLPAILAGALIPLAFFLFRHILGKERALVAAAFSAFSPLWIFSSSQADGEAIGVLAILVAVGAFLRFQETGNSLWLYGGACALGLGITSGLSVWTLAGEGIILAVLLRGKIKISELRVSHGFWIAFGASFFLSSTLFLFYPPGFGLVADSLALWLMSIFRGQLSFQPLLNLVLYEPLLILGALWGLERLYLLAPVIFGLLIAILGGFEGPAGFLPILLPLTVMAAYGLYDFIRILVRETFSPQGPVALVLTLCLGVWGFLGVTGYTVGGDTRYLLISVVALIGIVSILTFLGLMRGPEASVWVVLVFVLVASFLWEIKLARGLNFSPYVEEHLPRCQFTSSEVKEVKGSLRKLSSYRAGDPTALEVIVVGETPELRWYLKEFSALKVVEKGQILPVAEAIIALTEESISVGENFRGRRFAVRENCQIKTLKGFRLLRWLLYREPVAPREKEEAILWVKSSSPDRKHK
ncbi:MAG: glycosyltransferase family 39 protein [Anaerolineae bacterium]|nr:glycosyltransferase family 39 protein [Anaerolineae bacterium]MDW8101829.1 glycosyltransferase family 39 protein [Anaerolineae bacterium]